ncbi:MAG: TonB-dependent receptor [Armatimonadetes bacterium]|nr:TonB-dependent receptor [Armatimonadota bacterium]
MQRKLWILGATLLVLWCMVLGAQVAYAATTGVVSGAVTDSKTGDKVSGVKVAIISEALGLSFYGTTDKEGFFSVTAVPPGTYTVTAERIGFRKDVKQAATVVMDQTTTVDFALEPTPIQLAQERVEVIRSPLRRNETSDIYVVTRETEKQFAAAPGVLNSLFAATNSRPGVNPDGAIDSGGAGVLHVRGGWGNDIAWQLEGVPMYESLTNTFGSSLMSVGMDKLEMYTGAYPPEYGNAVSGVFNEVIKRGGTKFSGFADLQLVANPTLDPNANAGNLWQPRADFANIEFGGKSKKLSYYVGTIFGKQAFVYPEDQDLRVLKFWEFAPTQSRGTDNVFNFHYDSDDRNHWQFLFANGSSGTNFYGFEPTVFPVSLVNTDADTNLARYNVQKLEWTRRMRPGSTLVARIFRYDTGVNWMMPNAFFLQERRSINRGLHLEYTGQLSPKHLLKAGGSVYAFRNYYRQGLTQEFFMTRLGAPAGTTDPGEFVVPMAQIQTGFWIHDQYKPTSAWTLDLGLRYDSMNYRKVSAPEQTLSEVSPRIGVAYSPNRRNVYRASWGNLIWFPPARAVEQVYINAAGGASVQAEMIRGNVFDIGWEHMFSPAVTMKITPYWKNVTNFNFMNPGPPPTIMRTDRMESRGIEFLLERRMRDNMSGWISYTNSKTRMSNLNPANLAQMADASWDQEHVLSTGMNWRINKWELNPSLNYGSGFPYGLGTGNYFPDPDPVAGESAEPNTFRTNPNIVANLKITRQMGPQSQLYLNIYNLFNNRNAIYQWPAPGLAGTNPYLPMNAAFGWPTQFWPYGWNQPRIVQAGLRLGF